MRQGIYDLTIRQYHGGMGVSRSGIEEFRRSPLHYWHNYLNPEKIEEERPDIITRRNALDFGNVFHTYILERQEFDRRYLVIEKCDLRTKAGKEEMERLRATANGRELVCSESFQDVINMERAINNSTSASGLISGGLYEKSLFWIDKDTGILCKVRPDIWHNNFVGDLKTTTNAGFDEFSRSVYNFGYHIQAAMIHEALYALKGINMMNFVFVAIEKDAPHGLAVYRLNENAIRKGIEIFKKTLFEIKQCMDDDKWPSYPDAVIDLPAYAYINKEEL